MLSEVNAFSVRSACIGPLHDASRTPASLSYLCSSVGARQLADGPVRCRGEALERGLQVSCSNAVLSTWSCSYARTTDCRCEFCLRRLTGGSAYMRHI